MQSYCLLQLYDKHNYNEGVLGKFWGLSRTAALLHDWIPHLTVISPLLAIKQEIDFYQQHFFTKTKCTYSIQMSWQSKYTSRYSEYFLLLNRINFLPYHHEAEQRFLKLRTFGHRHLILISFLHWKHIILNSISMVDRQSDFMVTI